jgi:hypothetical protein
MIGVILGKEIKMIEKPFLGNTSQEPKTLTELIQYNTSKSKEIQHLVDRILKENPEVYTRILGFGHRINFDKFAEIAIMDFLVTAFSDIESGWERGYRPAAIRKDG